MSQQITIEVRTAYRRNTRKQSHTKADWEHLILPILEQYPNEVIFENPTIGIRTYHIQVPKDLALGWRTKLDQAFRRLGSTYGFSVHNPSKT